MGIGIDGSLLVPLLDAQGTRAAEQALFDDGLSVEALLETAVERIWAALSAREMRAPKGAARATRTEGRRVRWLVLVGPGHNGADGWALARKACEAGVEARVYEPLPGAPRKPLTEAQRRFALGQGVFEIKEHAFQMGTELEEADVRIDALFGFGLARDLDPALVAFLRRLDGVESVSRDASRPLRIAVDLPSGLCSDTGRARPYALPADETFVLGAMKEGLLGEATPAQTGRLHFIPLGLRRKEPMGGQDGMGQTEACSFLGPPVRLAALCSRRATEHKLSQGELIVVAGGARYPGAGILTLTAAQAARPGYVRFVSPSPESRTGVLALHPETIVADLSSALDSPGETFSRATAGVIGCGMEAPVDPLREAILGAYPRASHLVLDGAWCGPETVASARAKGHTVIITPHAGEFARAFPALGIALREGAISKAHAAREAAREADCYVVLKGPCTAIGAPDGSVWQGAIANPALARAGTGDVLAGFLGGLLVSALASGVPLLPVLASGVWWHGVFGMRDAGSEQDMLRRGPHRVDQGGAGVLDLVRHLAAATQR